MSRVRSFAVFVNLITPSFDVTLTAFCIILTTWLYNYPFSHNNEQKAKPVGVQPKLQTKVTT